MISTAEPRRPLRLLLVEDDEDDAELVRLELERGGFDVALERVDSEPALSTALDQDWDVIISDFAMPGFSGLRAFDIYRARGNVAPFIFVSGALGEDRAVEAMRAGARDYFLKGNLARLSVAVRRELAEATNRRQREAAEARALREQRRLALAIEASNLGVFELGDPGGSVEYGGPWTAILGVEPAELPSQPLEAQAWWLDRVHPEDRSAALTSLHAFLDGRIERYAAELRLRHGTGRWVDVAVFARATVRRPDGRAAQVAGAVLDLSARRQLEEQLRQAQKMEAVGQLAGGVAHDFNNLLTVILSFGAFALEQQSPGSSAIADLEEVLKAANRAQSLTKQLLAFSRRTTVTPRVLNVNQVIAKTERMLERLLGADVALVTDLASDLGSVKVDPDALEQVLLNLAVNARDAMAAGGKLTIATRNALLDEAATAASGGSCQPGAYIVVAVTDEGTGMDAATLGRIFEPFFTTKDASRGTGLGLSTCYGIVKQAGGFIAVDSQLGRGSTFKVSLPRTAESTSATLTAAKQGDPRGSEVILVAEDNPPVLLLTVRILTRLGYTVLQAENGREALDIGANLATPIDLLLTDLVMPLLNGRPLAAQLRRLRPGLPVLFMSGNAPGGDDEPGALDQEVGFLQKPFTPASLGQRVRESLDRAVRARLPVH